MWSLVFIVECIIFYILESRDGIYGNPVFPRDARFHKFMHVNVRGASHSDVHGHTENMIVSPKKAKPWKQDKHPDSNDMEMNMGNITRLNIMRTSVDRNSPAFLNPVHRTVIVLFCSSFLMLGGSVLGLLAILKRI